MGLESLSTTKYRRKQESMFPNNSWISPGITLRYIPGSLVCFFMLLSLFPAMTEIFQEIFQKKEIFVDKRNHLLYNDSRRSQSLCRNQQKFRRPSGKLWKSFGESRRFVPPRYSSECRRIRRGTSKRSGRSSTAFCKRQPFPGEKFTACTFSSRSSAMPTVCGRKAGRFWNGSSREIRFP